MRDLEELRRSRTDLSKFVPSDLTVHYLYARAFTALPPTEGSAEALDYFRTRATASWQGYRLYTRTLLALALHRTHTGADVPQRILRSARESARRSDELGMYWAEERGWFWYQAPIERQALLIEAFLEVASDAATAEEARIWLLKQKQVQDWRTTRATADAIYALLLGTPGPGGRTGNRTIELLAEVPAVTITVGREVYDARRTAAVQEAGTGYFKQTWTAEAVRPEMGRVQVTNPGREHRLGGALLAVLPAHRARHGKRRNAPAPATIALRRATECARAGAGTARTGRRPPRGRPPGRAPHPPRRPGDGVRSPPEPPRERPGAHRAALGLPHPGRPRLLPDHARRFHRLLLRLAAHRHLRV